MVHGHRSEYMILAWDVPQSKSEEFWQRKGRSFLCFHHNSRMHSAIRKYSMQMLNECLSVTFVLQLKQRQDQCHLMPSLRVDQFSVDP